MDLRWYRFNLIWLQDCAATSVWRSLVEDRNFPNLLFWIQNRYFPCLFWCLLSCSFPFSDQVFLNNGSVEFVMRNMHKFSTYKLGTSQFLHSCKMLSWFLIRRQIGTVKHHSLSTCTWLSRWFLPRICTSWFVSLNFELLGSRITHWRNNSSWYDKFCSDSFSTFLKLFLFVFCCECFFNFHSSMEALWSLISLFFLLRYLILWYYWRHTSIPLKWRGITLLLGHKLSCIHGWPSWLAIRLLLKLLFCWFFALRNFLTLAVCVQLFFHCNELCSIKISILFLPIFSAHSR